jgi:predicted GIY-YIG superfamily endonuclease
MHYVYLLKSINHQNQRYVGVTGDLKQRLLDHNAGRSAHTASHKPWELVVYVAFADKAKALAFERYLKAGSGHAFARRHFWG